MKSVNLFNCCVFLVLFTQAWMLEQRGEPHSRVHKLKKRQADLNTNTTAHGMRGSHGGSVQPTGSSTFETGRRWRSSSSSATQRRQFVSPDGQPYYQYQPHVSTSRGTGMSQTGSSSSSSSSSFSSSSSSSSSSSTGGRSGTAQSGYRRTYSGRVVNGSVPSNSQTYNYPFGRERIQYQYASSRQNASDGLSGGQPSGSSSFQTYRAGSGGSTTGQTSGSSSPGSDSVASGRWQVVPDRTNSRRIVANRRSSIDLAQRGVQQQGSQTSTTSERTPGLRPTSTYDTSAYGLSGRHPVSSSAGQSGSGLPAQTGYQQGTQTGYSQTGTSTGYSQTGYSQGTQTGYSQTGYPQGTQTGYSQTGYQQGVRQQGILPRQHGILPSSQQGSAQSGYQERRTGTGHTYYGTVVNSRGSQPTAQTSQQGTAGGSRTRQQIVYSRPTNTNPGYTATLQQVYPSTGSGGSSYYDQQTQTWRRYPVSGSSTQQSRGQQTYTSSRTNPYNPWSSTSNQECPETGIELRINGLTCHQAVQQMGSSLCYTHEFTSRQCCEVCRLRRQANRVGCEYGDHAQICSNITRSDCYDLRTRQTCCYSCERLRIPNAPAGCEYGDMTDQCSAIRQNRGLCYIPDNQRLCCNTCNNMRDQSNPSCQWGDYNSEMCQLFDEGSSRVRLNCYLPHRRRLCCQSCERLRQWIPDDVPANCEYGDRPVVFNTDQFGRLNCSTVIQRFSSNECVTNELVRSNCCYTCHRYLTRGRG